MPTQPAFAVVEHPRIGDALFQLPPPPFVAAEDSPLVQLRQRQRRLEIALLALQVARPSQRLWRYGQRWRVRLQKARRWMRAQAQEVRRRWR